MLALAHKYEEASNYTEGTVIENIYINNTFPVQINLEKLRFPPPLSHFL